jgi:hypothetical protein
MLCTQKAVFASERRDGIMTILQSVEALAELALAAKYVPGLRRREYEQLVANHFPMLRIAVSDILSQ